MSIAIWLQRHRTLARWLIRLPGFNDWLARRVWAHLEAQPGFHEEMAEARRSFEEHRTYVWDGETGLVYPSADWPKDGPQPKAPYLIERT